MNTKLTLNLDKNIIEKAKAYAKGNSISLSKLIENYLNSLTKPESGERANPKVSTLVKSLTGVLPTKNTDKYRDEYRNYLAEKYS